MRIFVALVAIACCSVCGSRNSQAPVEPAGESKSTKTKALETGAKVLQSTTPVNKMDIYLVGFHPMKDRPSIQMEAHHYCRQVNEDFAQCVLFDGNTETAQMNGVEYIISEKLFNSLPAEEKQYWHPHNYEVLSGELIAPGLPDIAEHSLMAQKINSYGKTWHVWMTDSKGKPVDKLPLGTPHLAWSFNHDGEIESGMIRSRDSRMNVNTNHKRQQRADLAQNARPQVGVNVLRKSFPNADGAPEGVKDVNDK